MTRHGGSIHFVRPDQIVRTSVLQPIVGYQPQNDVMMVTQEFTSGPASGMQLSGLGAPFGQGPIAQWFKQVGNGVRAAFARGRARRMMLTNAAAPMAPINQMASGSVILAAGPVIPPPAIMHAQGVAPQLHAMQDMARFLSMRGTAPMRGEMFPQRRWNTYFFSG